MLSLLKIKTLKKCYLGGTGPTTLYTLAQHAPSSVPSFLTLQKNFRITSHSAQWSWLKALIKLDSPCLTAVTLQEQTGLGLCRVEEGPAEPGPHPFLWLHV